MKNGDLKRFYDITNQVPKDFVRLGTDGKVPADLLPSYVDDVIEGYYYNSKFYKEAAHTTEITGESGKIYLDIPTGNTYRWGGTEFVRIGDGIDVNKLAEKMEGSIGIVADVNQAGTKVEVHMDLTGSAAGKILSVNNAGTGVEWTEKLPSTDGNLTKFLKVGSTGPAWDDVYYIKLSSMSLQETAEGSKIFKSITDFTGKHLHVMFEVETSGAHFATDFDLHPYNNSVCLVPVVMVIAGTETMGTAYIDANGLVNIDISAASSLTGYTIIAKYYEYK